MPRPFVAMLALSALLITGCGADTSQEDAAAKTSTPESSTPEPQPRTPKPVSGPAGTIMPDVVGMTVLEAEDAMYDADLDSYEADTKKSSPPLDEDVVVMTLPEAGEALNGSDDIILVSRTPEEAADHAEAVAEREEEERKEAREAEAEQIAEEERAAEKKAEAKAKAKALKPIVYEGYGPDVINIKKKSDYYQPARISHTGYSNFIVSTLDSGLDMSDLLVNTIGNYSGVVLFDDDFGGSGEDTKALEVQADGAWKVELLSMDALQSFNGSKTISGTGDDVFRYTGDDGIATINYTGGSNIIVLSFGDDTDLAVNDIGPYKGTVVLQSGIIEIKSEGPWTIDFK